MQIIKPERNIRWKLAAAFIAVASFVAVFVAVVTAIHVSTVERAAQLEATNVAALIADTASDSLSPRSTMQDYVDRLNASQKRDVVIVDKAKKGLADADPAEIGLTYDHDSANEVASTIGDKKTRMFVEQNDLHPDGARQVVVAPTAGARQTPIGAVILEYTPILEELLAAERGQMYLIIAGGSLAVILVIFFGIGIAGRIAQPLHDLKAGAERIAAQDYDARVAVTSRDEIGALGAAFNKMAEDLSASHTQVLAHRRELEQRVASRTEELNAANVLLQQEVLEHQRAAERAEYLASYDSLTGLPNRSMFSNLLRQALSMARRESTLLGVLFVDLDRFKNINDTLGHDAGDLLLQEVAQRLKACLRDSDTVARLGGDEFVVLLPAVKTIAEINVVAHKILSSTSKSFVAHGQEFRITASVGASTFPANGDDEQSLMKNADIAMYQAKEGGRNNFQFYSEQMNANSFERLALESSLRRALEQGEFELHYQPKVHAQSGTISSMEALLRWHHPELGMVMPAKFIPIAEETGLIVPIGKWVLRAACTQIVAWQKAGLPGLSVAVNLSGRQFSDEELLPDLTAILLDTGMNPALLELEITESTLMHDADKALRTLQAFKELGVQLAIDDFGTGYSSLSNLRNFPIDTIKIDGSFIRDVDTDAENRGIAEAIIAMGRTLNMTVVAECVETQGQVDFLRGQACDEYQGFYFSEALPAQEFSAWLAASRSDATGLRRKAADSNTARLRLINSKG